MKLNENNNQEDSKMSSDVIATGYVKQMVSRFSSGFSNDGNGSDGQRNNASNTFKVPRLHSTRLSFKSDEKPKPFHYPVLLVNRSSIPTKTFFNKSFSINSSNTNGQSSLPEGENFKSSHPPCLDSDARTQNETHLPKCTESNSPLSSCASYQLKDEDFLTPVLASTNCVHETENGLLDQEPVSYQSVGKEYAYINNTETDQAVEGLSMGPDLKNGDYFMELMKEKELLLNEKCSKFDSQLGPEIPDEASGKIRAAIGKANLLLHKKFSQFRGLCQRNMSTESEDQFQVTSQDLEGFWDLVLIQVADVITSFEELSELRKNDWKRSNVENELQRSLSNQKSVETPSKSRETTPSAKTPKKGKSPGCSAEQRRLRAAILAGRRQRKTSQNDEEVQIFISERS